MLKAQICTDNSKIFIRKEPECLTTISIIQYWWLVWDKEWGDWHAASLCKYIMRLWTSDGNNCRWAVCGVQSSSRISVAHSFGEDCSRAEKWNKQVYLIASEGSFESCCWIHRGLDDYHHLPFRSASRMIGLIVQTRNHSRLSLLVLSLSWSQTVTRIHSMTLANKQACSTSTTYLNSCSRRRKRRRRSNTLPICNLSNFLWIQLASTCATAFRRPTVYAHVGGCRVA